MCGIIGVLGYCKCYKHILGGLKQLQNRGYDSAGMCTLDSNFKFLINKFASTQSDNALEKLEYYKNIHENDTIGIGHTRWATHGGKTDSNAHPHFDMHKKLSLVHNGIIENYQELKNFLEEKGYIFKSQTDTEVVANLISFEYEKCKSEEKAILKSAKQLSGTYALVIMFSDSPDKLFCIRYGSPLLIGINDDKNLALVTSEQSGFCGNVSNYYAIDNHNLCILSKKDGKVFFNPQRVTFEELKISSDYSNSNQLVNYPHWTLKEIDEQVDSSSRALSNGGRLLNDNEVKLGGLEHFAENLEKIQHLIILGCGTSFHAGLIASHYFKELCNFITVELFDAAEFTPNDFPKTDDKIGCIFMSQSGETQDLYRCVKIAKNRNAYTIGVINVVDSLIAREVDCGVYLNAGKEVAVASTKSFTSQLIVMMLIACWFSQKHSKISHSFGELVDKKRRKYIEELTMLPNLIQQTIDASLEICPSIVEYFDNFESCFILGKGTGEGIAKEGSLKIKEISYIHSEGYSASALKHGPFALLKKDFPVIILGMDNDHYDKCLNALEEIKSRHANVIFITNKKVPHNLKADTVIQLPENTQKIGDILSIIPLQTLSYYLSVRRNINPDFPRNLAKVVTVE